MIDTIINTNAGGIGMAEMYKIRTKNKDVFLRVAKGHFATMHSHTNY